MIIALILTVQAVWSPTKGDPAESRAAAALFVEACLQGKVSLANGRGEILPAETQPDFAEVIDWNKPAKRTIIKFRQPAETYLVLAEYKYAAKHGFARSCYLVSRKLNGDDAQRALLVGSEGMKPKQTWWPNFYFPEWTIDAPKLGYYKRMKMRDNRSMLLEYSMYADSSN